MLLTQHSMLFTQPSHHGNLRPFFLDLFPVPEACFLGSLDCDDNIDDMKSTFSFFDCWPSMTVPLSWSLTFATIKVY